MSSAASQVILVQLPIVCFLLLSIAQQSDAFAIPLKINTKCIRFQRECLTSCTDRGDEWDYCQSECSRKFPCKQASCPYEFPLMCNLEDKTRPHECYTDLDCSVPARCCRYGQNGCIRRCTLPGHVFAEGEIEGTFDYESADPI